MRVGEHFNITDRCPDISLSAYNPGYAPSYEKTRKTMLKSVWIIVKNAFKEDVENSYAKVWRLIINSGINLSTHNGK